MIEQPIDHTVTTLTGDTFSLRVYRGMPLLIVNTACRDKHRVAQLGELQQLYDLYAPRGFEVVAFPCDDFGEELSRDAEIFAFLTERYGVTFSVCSLCQCTGPDQAPVFRTLTEFSATAAGGPIIGNFTKFLVDVDGYAIERFGPDVSPMDATLREALSYALPTKM